MGGDPFDESGRILKRFEPNIMPFVNNGIFGSNQLRNAISQFLSQGPVGFENSIMSQYRKSPYAQRQVQQATEAANRAGAAGGYLGTPQEQQQLAGDVQGIVSKDQNQFYQNAVQPYEFGTQAAGQMAGQGLQANQQLWQYLQALANNQAASAGWSAQNHGAGGIFNALGRLAGLAGNIAGIPGIGSLFGGGALAGGLEGLGNGAALAGMFM
jgi:uncharacterized protein YdbL (DUF1318 family)